MSINDYTVYMVGKQTQYGQIVDYKKSFVLLPDDKICMYLTCTMILAYRQIGWPTF